MTGNQLVEPNKIGIQVADALESCNWANAPIGNKAILAQAIALLRADQRQGVLLGYIWPEEIDGPNRCRVMTVSRPGDFLPNMIPVYQVPQLIQGEPVALPARRQWNGLGNAADNLKAAGWNACLMAVEKIGPLYAHAGPGAAELLRSCLRTEVEAGDSWKREAEDLRDQLTAQGALLDRMAYYLSPALASHQYSMSQETMHDALEALHEWRKLKADAEPAARECNACQGSGYAHANGMPVTGACNTCHGKGVVDDGEIAESGGLPFENGPVKCVKNCPDCKS